MSFGFLFLNPALEINLLNTRNVGISFDFLEANQSWNRGVPLFFPTDSHPLSLSDLLWNRMPTGHAIRAHAQEVWDKSDKD